MKRIKRYIIGFLYRLVLDDFRKNMTVAMTESIDKAQPLMQQNAMKCIESVRAEEEKLPDHKLMTIFKPFGKGAEHPQTEKYAIAGMSETLLEGIARIADDLERELSNAAMRQTGDEHYRRLWMAFGVQTLLDKITAKRTAFEAFKNGEQKKKEQVVKQTKIEMHLATMQDIYDAAPK